MTKVQYQKRRQRDLCVWCGAKTPKGQSRCQKHVVASKQQRQQRKENGLCATCGKKAVKGRSSCQTHLDYAKAQTAKKLKQRATSNQCMHIGCGRVRVTDRKRCRLHLAESNASRLGITAKEYVAVVAQARGRCAICKTKVKRLEVDHCHRTGQVRGAICGACNKTLGSARDNPETLRRAAAYLKLWTGRLS